MSSKQSQQGRTTFGTLSPLLDGMNLRLLRELQLDPRQATSKLARKLGMSAPAVSERVQRLREAGVITGCRLDLDPRALGLPVTAYVRIRPGPGQLSRIADLAQSTPEVVECHRITGEDCFLLKIHVAEVNGIEAILDRFLAHGQTTTSIVQSSPVPLRGLPVPGR